jgi:hypothetical protein
MTTTPQQAASAAAQNNPSEHLVGAVERLEAITRVIERVRPGPHNTTVDGAMVKIIMTIDAAQEHVSDLCGLLDALNRRPSLPVEGDGLVEALKRIIKTDRDEFGEEGPCALLARKALASHSPGGSLHSSGDVEGLVEAAKKVIEACDVGLLSAPILGALRQALPADDERKCNRCGAENPEFDVEVCGDRRCPYKPQPRAAFTRPEEA